MDRSFARNTASISEKYSVEIIEDNGDTMRAQFNTVIPVVIDFESEYVMKYSFSPESTISWEAEPDGTLEGVAGSWELAELGANQTLALYRNTSDLESHGIMMRQLLKLEPTFEQAIQASQTIYVIDGMKKYCEATPEQRARLVEEAKKK